MKTELTTDKSKKLIEMGISPDCASMIYWTATRDFQDLPIKDQKWHLELKPFRPAVMGFESFTCLDKFNIGDLLKILPSCILDEHVNYSFRMTTVNDGKSNIVGYFHNDGLRLVEIQQTELIDCLYELVMWCIENDKLNRQ